MKIEKAIELLTDEANSPRYTYDPDRRDAIKLSIEALKCVKEIRYHPFPDSVLSLPGETK